MSEGRAGRWLGLWVFLVAVALALSTGVGCARGGRVDGDGDVDGDVDSDGDLDADVDADGDGDVDADGDADGDGDVDGDVEQDADTPVVDCECPPPLTSCQTIPQVAFSYWDESLAVQLLQGIACATTTLDIVVYDINAPCLVDAILEAVEANPELVVRVVTEFETCGRVGGVLACELSRLEEAGAAEVVLDNRASYLMHDKIMIIDGVEAVISTANWTDNGLCEEHNGSVFTDDPVIVSALSAEFDRFFVDESFGAPEWAEPVDGVTMDLFFSPSGADWQDEMLRQIEEADGTIRFMIFAFTREDLAAAMIAAADRGVVVQGVISHRFYTATYPAIVAMDEADLDIRVANVHHKSTLIESSSGDVLVTGSGNLSTAAREHNNEVVLFVDDPTMYDAFSDEFERVWALGEDATLGD